MPDDYETSLANIANRVGQPPAPVPNPPDHMTIVTQLHMQIQSLTLQMNELQRRVQGEGHSGTPPDGGAGQGGNTDWPDGPVR
jgi:hypothetical protein